MTNSIFLTRREYDNAIVDSPQEIRDAYDRCCTSWSLRGVKIEGAAKDVTAIHLRRVERGADPCPDCDGEGVIVRGDQETPCGTCSD